MLNISKTALGIAAASVCFVAYCVYFDRKRRSDPLFKQKLRERRQKNKTKKDVPGTVFPDLKDSEAMQKFFMQEIQIGERVLAEGNIEEGVEHITNAVAVCGQPQQLLSILQQTLPQQVFQLLLQRLPLVSQKISSAIMCEASQSKTSSGAPADIELELE